MTAHSSSSSASKALPTVAAPTLIRTSIPSYFQPLQVLNHALVVKLDRTNYILWFHIWRAGSLCIFWTVWKTINRIAFEDEVLSIQMMKTYFLNSLCSETNLFIKDGPLTFLEFIDWVGSY